MHEPEYLATSSDRVISSASWYDDWPLVEGSLFLLSHPMPFQAAKPPKPIPFRL